MMTAHPAAGRPRDPDVDRRVGRAALELFGEVGWAGFAMEAVARRAAVGKASLYLRWAGKEALLADALTAHLARAADVDTGSLRDDLCELAYQMLDMYAGDTRGAAVRLALEGSAIPGLAEFSESLRSSQILAARAIVRRGKRRGELAADAPATVLLEALTGAALMHGLAAWPGGPAELAPALRAYAGRLVDFLLRAVTAPPP